MGPSDDCVFHEKDRKIVSCRNTNQLQRFDKERVCYGEGHKIRNPSRAFISDQPAKKVVISLFTYELARWKSAFGVNQQPAVLS
jgi:hypothetical protein